jgi:hypothetical protein
MARLRPGLFAFSQTKETMIMAPRKAYSQPQAGAQGFARTKKVFGGPTITLIAADVALYVAPGPTGLVAVCRVPKDFIVTSMNAVFGACDSGATLSMSIGDNGSVTYGVAANLARFAATSTTPRAGGTVNLAATAVGYQFLEETDILLNTTAAAAGLGATPTVNLTMEGYIGP